MYKQPKVKIEHTCICKCMENIVNYLMCSHQNIMIIGDINVNMQKPNHLSNLIDVLGLYNLVKSPTFL